MDKCFGLKITTCHRQTLRNKRKPREAPMLFAEKVKVSLVETTGGLFGDEPKGSPHGSPQSSTRIASPWRMVPPCSTLA